jgi:hypothetical protein
MGRVAARRGDLAFSISAGNVPYVMLMYAWGGQEGTRFFSDINLSAIAPNGGVASLW